MAGTVLPGFLTSRDRRGVLDVEASLDLPSARVLRVVWAELEFYVHRLIRGRIGQFSHRGSHVMLPAFVIDALAKTAKGKGRDDLLWSTHGPGYLGPPSTTVSWLSGAVARCQKKIPSSPGLRRMRCVIPLPRWRSALARTRRLLRACSVTPARR